MAHAPGCLDSLDFRQRMYQASLAMRISVNFSRLLLNWVATYRHNMRVIIPNRSSVRYTWLNDGTVTHTQTKLQDKTRKNLLLLVFSYWLDPWWRSTL